MSPRNLPALALLILLVSVFLLRFLLLGHAIYGDGIYYWAYTRSAVIDLDLSLTNESLHAYSPEGNNSIEPNTSNSGRQLTDDRYFPLGASLLWIPAFGLAHVAAVPLGYLNNGYSDVYQISVGVMNISFAVIALLIIWSTIRKQFDKFTSLVALTACLFATNLIYYTSIDVLNTHPGAFLLGSLALYILFNKYKITNKYSFLSGVITGFCALIRPQDALFAILFLPDILKERKLKTFCMFIAGVFIGFSPQILTSLVIFGNIFQMPYIKGGNTFDVLNPHLVELIFDKTRGILYFSPIYILGILGLLIYFQQKKAYSGRIILLVLSEIFVISVWSGWAQGESYGLRMIISLIPVFALGICELINLSKKYISHSAIIAIVVLLIFQNFVMIAAFHLLLHEPTFVDGELSRGGKIKQEILLELESHLR